jgi:hypothetical protein
LGEELGKAEPARRREVFRLFVDRIELRFDQVKQGKKTTCPLQSGEIYLRTGEGTIFGSVSRGDWTAIELFIASVHGWEAGFRRQFDDCRFRSDWQHA